MCRPVLVLSFLGILLSACERTPPPSSPPKHPEEPMMMVSAEERPEGINVQERSCRNESECVLSRFNGCCTCPRPEPYAIHREALAVNESTCMGVECDEAHACEPPPVDDSEWEASCQAEHCIAERR